jgi:HAD domain in Swiss Army Knife RNA repair proteins
MMKSVVAQTDSLRHVRETPPVKNVGPSPLGDKPDKREMNIIFLDFDGVLNDRKWLVRDGARDDLDPERVKLLNWLVRATEAKIVISSSWRILHPLEELQLILDRAGFLGEILGVTPGGGGVRGTQIQRWIDSNNFKGQFVILDDDSDMEHLMDRLVKTNFETGLQPQHVKSAIALLRPDPIQA